VVVVEIVVVIWENHGIVKTYNHQHGQTTPVGMSSTTGVCSNSRSNENHNHRLEDHEYDTRLAAKVHEARSCETTNRKETLGNGVEVCALDVCLGNIEIRASLLEVVDEVGCDTDLGTDIRELSKGSPEQGVLLAERLVDVASCSCGHLSLVGHVGVCDFRDGREEEDDGENGDEARDAEVDPLNGLEGATVFADVLEDDLGCENGCYDGADSLDGLGKLETELGPPGRTANCLK
jgi:hypothetical protein